MNSLHGDHLGPQREPAQAPNGVAKYWFSISATRRAGGEVIGSVAEGASKSMGTWLEGTDWIPTPFQFGGLCFNRLVLLCAGMCLSIPLMRR